MPRKGSVWRTMLDLIVSTFLVVTIGGYAGMGDFDAATFFLFLLAAWFWSMTKEG